MPRQPAPIDSLIAHFGGGWVPLPLDDAALTELRAELARRERHRRGAR